MPTTEAEQTALHENIARGCVDEGHVVLGRHET